MAADSAGLTRWTRAFAVLSASMLVGYFGAVAFDVGHQTVVTIGVFGFVCPMVFGMAYLLIPSYVGRTLIDQRFAGIHFLCTAGSLGLLLTNHPFGEPLSVAILGSLLWALGVLVFVTSLTLTVAPVLWRRVRFGIGRNDRSRRSPRLGAAMIPIAIGYLVAGTFGFVASTTADELIPVQGVVHLYAAGFGALLIFALGGRLLTGFFHVSPPRYGIALVLVPGGIAPAFLGMALWMNPWFRIGAVLETVAMAGYLVLVAFVAYHSDWDRVGIFGIVSGAVLGTAAVVLGALMAFYVGGYTSEHASLILGGFFPLTIVGYAYQFFPITSGQFLGADERTAVATIALLGIGTMLYAGGVGFRHAALQFWGASISLVGAAGYWYLLVRRFWRDR